MTATTPAPMPAPAPPPLLAPAAADGESAARARWERPALAALLGGTALLSLWGLSESGWANAFYSAAAQAGSVSWKAFFYGSSDAANAITVDKTPLSLWVMALSARMFGVTSWSILAPQALMGVASVGLLHATVRRWSTPAAGLIAGAVLALTPVAVLMFTFNNPDALLVLLLIGSAYATVRALEAASARWVALAGVLVGLGFMTKMLQAFLVVPALALVYLIAAPTTVRRRLVHLVGALASMVVSGGWWVAVVELVPEQYRPYVGGSQHNSVIELTLGYNGLGRLNGDETGSVGGGPLRGWGQVGLTRMVDAEIGGQVAWLLPAALVLLVAGLWLRGRAPRTDRPRAAYLLWGLWLLVTGLTFSLMAGIFHAYYTIALAPAIGALVGMGVSDLWQRRRTLLAPVLLALTLAGTAVWSWQLLGRSADFYPAVRAAVIVVGPAVALALLVVGRLGRRVTGTLAAAAVLVGMTGPTAYALQTATTGHSGAIPSAGPFVAGGFGPGRGGLPGGMPGAGGATRGPGAQSGPPPGMVAPGGQGGPGGASGQGMPGGMGGLLDAAAPNAELVNALRQNASAYTWVAAAVGSNAAAGAQLATGLPVMSVGGFNGSDPSPTLAQFQQYVAAGRIHYFLGGGGMRPNGGSTSSADIAAWVQENFTATTLGGTTVYDLTRAGG